MDSLYFVVHTHWDREWYQPFQQMRARLVAMADRMIPMVERGTIPFFHFDGQTIVLEDYLEVRPRAERRLRDLVRAGKIQIGPWYVLADSFLVSGESLIRNLEIGMTIARRFGRPLEVGYLPDQFGHIAQMPQILAGFGFTTAVLWRGVGADVTRNRFTWEALDGSAVLTIYMPNGYSNGANLPLESVESFIARAEQIADREREFANGAPILVMNGTDHADPDPRLITRINEARETSAITFEVGPLETYVRRIVDLPLDGTPTHRGELRSPLRAHLLPGVTSARTWIKQRDFENCRALERYADPLAALANALGRGDGLDAYLEMAWRMAIQNHPHDSICGCSVDQVHTDMRYRFDQVRMLAETAIRRAANACLTEAGAHALEFVVFNPSFSRRALVSGEVEVSGPSAGYAVQTSDGQRLPVTIDVARAERARCTINFVADDLTQAGFSSFRLVARDSRVAEAIAVEASRTSIENEFFRLMPTSRGLDIRDLKRDATMELHFEDEGNRGDEYNFDPVADSPAIAEPASISSRVLDDGPNRRRIALTIGFDIPAALATDRRSRSLERERLTIELLATLYSGLDRVDFIADVINPARDHRLRIALHTPITAADAVHDTSFGVVRRPLAPSEPRGTEVIYPTVPHRTFTAVEGADFSAAMMSKGILEVEVRPEPAGSTILLTLLRCVGWLSRSDLATRRGGAGPELETPDAQEIGAHRFEFAVATFSGSYLDDDLLARVESYTSRPRLFHARKTGERDSLLRCNNPRIVFSTARPIGRAGSFKVRVYSASPNPEQARFTFGESSFARIVDFAGRATKRAAVKRSRDGALTLELRPFEILTFEVRARRRA
jgi:mannosylglycerate hydrolase